MRKHAIAGSIRPQRPGSKTRRWDIDQAILTLLESGPRTASNLFRLLNPGVRRIWVQTARGWKRLWINVTVDYRVLVRHLGYLQRDGLIVCEPWLKVLGHDRGAVAWKVKYYGLADKQGSATPSPSPFLVPTLVSKIHNPFHGEEGMIRYMRWLRDPASQPPQPPKKPETTIERP